MKRLYISLSVLSLLGCASVQREPHNGYFGLTQAQLAAKVGFPLRVYTLPARNRGGPGILFWVYYQKSPNGTIEEKEFIFDRTPLKVNSITGETMPSQFLSLDDPQQFQDIYRYNRDHGL